MSKNPLLSKYGSITSLVTWREIINGWVNIWVIEREFNNPIRTANVRLTI
jgi:hypothetical protein